MNETTKSLAIAIGVVSCIGALGVAGMLLKEKPQSEFDANVITAGAAGSFELNPTITSEPATEPVSGATASPEPPAASADAANPDAQTPPPIIIYTGDGCPHCEKVIAYLKENGILGHPQLQVKEVFKDEANKAEFEQVAVGHCKLEQDKIGVPILAMSEGCLQGDEEIIKFFDGALTQAQAQENGASPEQGAPVAPPASVRPAGSSVPPAP